MKVSKSEGLQNIRLLKIMMRNSVGRYSEQIGLVFIRYVALLMNPSRCYQAKMRCYAHQLPKALIFAFIGHRPIQRKTLF